jgi:hypothetical protein
MASTDAKPVPQKNVAYRVTFPILDADGDLVTGATGLDSEISKDAGTFADCTNEATEIATSSGVYYLDLTSTEMNADTVAIIVKTSTSGAKTTVLVMYPEEAGDIRVNATQLNGTGLTGRDIGASVLLSSGTGTGQLSITSGVVNANVTLIEGSDATNQIRDSIVDDATRIDASALNTLSSHDPGETIMGATDLGTGSGLTSLASAANLATLTGYVDTEVAAIKAKTDNLPSDPADASDIASAFSTVNGKLDTIDGVVDAILVDTGTTLDGKIDTIDTVVDAIKAVTDNLPDSGALTSLATASALATVDGVVDAIKVKTDSLTFTEAGTVDANIQRINDVAITGDGQPGTEFGV